MASRKSRRTRQEDPEEISSHSNKHDKADESPNNFTTEGAAGGAGLENTVENKVKARNWMMMMMMMMKVWSQLELSFTIEDMCKAMCHCQGKCCLTESKLGIAFKPFKAMAQHCQLT